MGRFLPNQEISVRAWWTDGKVGCQSGDLVIYQRPRLSRYGPYLNGRFDLHRLVLTVTRQSIFGFHYQGQTLSSLKVGAFIMPADLNDIWRSAHGDSCAVFRDGQLIAGNLMRPT